MSVRISSSNLSIPTMDKQFAALMCSNPPSYGNGLRLCARHLGRPFGSCSLNLPVSIQA